jgi:transcriptional regulator with XRE-family HTH domain
MNIMDRAERLKKLRKERKISQQELANISGVAQQTISNIECGRNEPSADTIRMLAAALGISASEFLGEDIILSEHKLTPREFAMITEFRKLNPVGQKQLIDLAAFYQTKEEYQRR